MLRAVLLYLSENEKLRDLVLRRPFARTLARRFVAGETLDEAMGVCRALNARGLSVSLDYLGERVTNRAEAERSVRAYLAALDRVAAEGVDAYISLKLTQLGLDIDEGFCAQKLARVAHRAAELGKFVRIDMENSAYVDATCRLFRGLFPRYRNLGIVLQSCLYRSEADARELCALGAPVRLCKGAYKEPETVAFPKKEDVDRNYECLLAILFECGSPLAVATHDARLIEAAKEIARGRGDARGSRGTGGSVESGRLGNSAPAFEFQMLYGVRRDLQERLVREGFRMRVYLPYGTQWYAYLMRRMAERPANLWFVVRAVLQERGRR